MKKLLLAIVLVFSGLTLSNVFPETSLQAAAKEKPLTKTIVKSLKKGTLPQAKGKVGSKKKNLKIKQNSNGYWYDPKKVSETNWEDSYTFNATNVTSNSKVVLIQRQYNYYIPDSSIKKHLGKKLKLKQPPKIGDASEVSFYKVGKYYVCFDKMKQGKASYTFILIGTKKAIADNYQMKF